MSDEAKETVEFASISIRIDHLSRTPQDDNEVAIPVLYSTLDADQQFVKQVAYFSAKGEGRNLMMLRETRQQLAVYESAPSAIIYTPSERITNVIVDSELFLSIMAGAGGGSFMGTLSVFVELAIDAYRFARSNGATGEMVVWSPREEAPPAEVAAEEPVVATRSRGRGKVTS